MSLAEVEEEKKQFVEQLDIVHGQLRDDSDNAELKSLQEELNNLIDLLNENIAELKPKQAPKPAAKQQASSPPPPSSEPEKWSRENHPAFKKASATPPPPPAEEDAAPVNYQVNDTVLAKWLSGDKQFYPAKITSVTGSSTAPIYLVKFKSYNNTETLRSKDIKPISNKRKATEAPAASVTPPLSGQAAQPPPPPKSSAPAPGVVSSAGATRYPDANKGAEQGDQAAKPPKAKKIRANKELEAGKNKWQQFNSKSKFGKTKKDSMFRTPESATGRVGFTGSGQAMRKDPGRSRHVYQINEELD